MKYSMIVFSILVTACASTTIKYNYQPSMQKFNIPSLNVIESVGLGETILDQGVSTTKDVFQITRESQIVGYKIKPGKLNKVGGDLEYEYFVQDIGSGYTIYSGLIIPSPDASATVLYKRSNREFCIVRPFDLQVCGTIYGNRKNETVITSESFRRTLVYGGRIGDRLKIIYREFSDNFARPAFNTEVEYDLSQSSIIGYAGARIEIISATNTEIEYKVLKGFNEQ
ncbi:hypothetical protein [Thalassolituus oleivorans]|jgi:hypothetical protein|uniref:Lipoprotein n=1 Tax=Thalassolituus oleivorans MIL-1 TaxID=1298593 RepID=M5DTJ0_9GAMM|nr:hypothetical protein [Thalassolituus oleivorans]CCU73221.1 hypothetical protein TOL_2825 [Thalassolituus oleivorans MIL-1]